MKNALTQKQMEDQNVRSELRDYAWNYFAVHANQRLEAFRFFLVMNTIIAGGIFTLLKDGKNFEYTWPLPLLLTFLSFVFWKLDIRNKQLIKHGETALKYIEKNSGITKQRKSEKPHIIQLFLSEEYKTKKKSRFPKAGLIHAHFSYSTCFNIVFFVFGAIGISLSIFFLLKAY